MPQSLHCELDVRRSEIRVVTSGIQFHRVILGCACHSSKPAKQTDVKLFSLPRLQAFFDLLGKPVRVGCGAKCFPGEDRRCLVMAMTVAFRS